MNAASGPTLRPETRLRIASSVYVRPFGDEIVVLDFGRGEYFALDEIGAFVWRGIERGEALAAVAASVAESYAVTHEVALADILALSNDLVAHTLVEVEVER